MKQAIIKRTYLLDKKRDIGWVTTYCLYVISNSFLSHTPDDKNTYCAWCNKSVYEIGRENLDKHIDQHIDEDIKQ